MARPMLNAKFPTTNPSPMQTITPFLWFDDKAGEAAKFYTSIFKNSKIVNVKWDGKKFMSVTFRINGQELIAFNGGPHFKFTPAISLFVECKTQKEVDGLWKKLLKGGKAQRCGWLKDKYGLSWQIIPAILGELLADNDPAKSERVFDAMMKMVKIDIKTLERAHTG
jgi:predicted 3-demethylubiquinone-9 3-methyltransferase (glyoxalase superfamily)